jgi:hypothetical protein
LKSSIALCDRAKRTYKRVGCELYEARHGKRSRRR